MAIPDKCQCEKPGFCKFHQLNMPQVFWEYCQGKSGLKRDREVYYLQNIQDFLGTPVSAPSLLDKAVNLSKAVVRHAVDGFAKTELPLLNQRLAICGRCPMKSGNICAKCGCILSIKASWASERCPLGKWPGETPNGNCNCGGS